MDHIILTMILVFVGMCNCVPIDEKKKIYRSQFVAMMRRGGKRESVCVWFWYLVWCNYDRVVAVCPSTLHMVLNSYYLYNT